MACPPKYILDAYKYTIELFLNFIFLFFLVYK
nr:MAG TPA: hypothetical protein [Crassvirales sp.]